MNLIMCDWNGCRSMFEWKSNGDPKGWLGLVKLDMSKRRGDSIPYDDQILLCPAHSKLLQNSVGVDLEKEEK